MPEENQGKELLDRALDSGSASPFFDLSRRSETPRRLKKLTISVELLSHLLRGANSLVPGIGPHGTPMVRLITADLPDDFKIIHASWNYAAGGIDLICTSESFEAIEASRGTLLELPSLLVWWHQELLTAQEIKDRLDGLASGNAEAPHA